jgi:hypothetical protein
MMFTAPQITALLVIALLGHTMSLFWYVADKSYWKLCERRIYDLHIGNEQIKREIKNSLHAPMHAVILAGFLYLGCFEATSLASFFYSALATTLWAEVWHYAPCLPSAIASLDRSGTS